jgi:hypothetical protein
MEKEFYTESSEDTEGVEKLRGKEEGTDLEVCPLSRYVG